MDDKAGDAPLSPEEIAALVRREEILDEFESAWRSSSRPHITEYLRRVHAAEQSLLLKELLRIDWEYRQECGEFPSLTEYAALLPDHAEPLADAMAEFLAAHQPDVVSQSNASTAPDPDVPRLTNERVANTETQSFAGAIIGLYEIQNEVGRGGMGVVYRARHLRLNRNVALKVIRAGHHATNDDVRRFQLEAMLAAQLDHPGIVPVYEAAEVRGQSYIAMGFVSGQSLWQKIQQAPLTPTEAARLIQAVAEAVQFAHDKQIIHRDIKPQNVLVSTDGQPKITDFGLAKLTSTGSDLTATGQVVGTPSYMPPEQAAGRSDEIGPRTDVYSLGATLYCALTGRPPFQTANAVETLRQVQEQEPVSPRVLNPAVDRDLATICLKCLQKNPAHRYSKAAELAADLQRFLRKEPIHARPVTWIEKGLRWCRRNPIAVALVASFVLLIALGSLTVRIVEDAKRNQRLARFSDDFERLLDHPAITTNYVAEAETLIAPIAEISPLRADQARDRFWTVFAKVIETSITRSKLTADDERRLQAALDSLRLTKPAEGDRLAKLLAVRLRNWQTLFEIAGPFSNPPSVFPQSSVSVREGRLFSTVSASNAPRDSDLPVIHAQETATGKIRWELLVDASSPHVLECGCEFRYDEKSHYRYVVKLPKSDVGSTGPISGDNSPAFARRNVTVQILRNNLVLRETVLPTDGITGNKLSLIAERDGEQLSFQVGNLQRLEFYDVFAIHSSSPVRFGVIWPADLQLLRAKAQRMPAATSPSPLEKGDDLYLSGQYGEALEAYRRVQREDDNPSLDQESRYKQAVCSRNLERIADAIGLLEPLSTERGERWPAMASIQLWLLHIKAGRREDADRIFDRIAVASSINETASLIPEDLRSEIMNFYRARHGSRLSRTLIYDPQLIQRLKRQIQLEDILGNSPRSRFQVGLDLINAEWSAGNHDRCWKLIEDLYEKYPTLALQVFMQSQFKRDRPEIALEAVDQRIYQKDGRLNPSLDAWLWLRRAECHARLGKWESAEQDLAELYRSALRLEQEEVMYIDFQSALLNGLLLEMRGDQAGAVAAWRKGIPTDPRLRANLYMPAEYIFLRALSGDIDTTDCERLIDKLQGDSAGTVTRVARGVISPETVLPIVRAMFQSRYGKELIWRMATGELFDSEVTRWLVVLCGFEFVRQGAFQGQMTDEQQEVLYSTADELYRAFTVQGKINVVHAGQGALAWKGNLGFVGWGGLAAILTPDLRGPLAYFVAHRAMARSPGMFPEQVSSLLRTAQADAKPQSPLHQLATLDLELLSTKSGIVRIQSTSREPLEVQVSSGDVLHKAVTVNRLAELELPVGEYRLKLVAETAGYTLSHDQLSILPCARREVSIVSAWEPTDPRRSFPGVIAAPAARPGINRWQIASKHVVGPIVAAALAPDGASIAIGDQQGIVRVHSLTDGNLRAALPGHQGVVTHLSWNDDFQRLASAGVDKSVRTWDVSARAAGFVIDHPMGAIRVLGWNPKQMSLHCGFGSEPAGIWNREGIQQGQFAAPIDDLMVWNTNGELLASNHGADIYLNSPAAGPIPALKGHSDQINSLAWNADGTRLASSALDRSIRIWHEGTWRSELGFAATGDVIEGLAWNPQGDRLACGKGEAGLSVFRYPGFGLEWQATLPGKLETVQWSPDGQAVFSTVRDQKSLSVVSSTPAAATIVHRWSTSPVIAALSTSGTHVLRSHPDNHALELWDAKGPFKREIVTDGDIISSRHTWSPDDRQLAIARKTGEIEIIDADTGDSKKVISGINARFNELSWCQDSKALAIQSENNVFVCREESNWKPATIEIGHPIRFCHWQPGSEWLTLMYLDDPQQIHFWNAHTGKQGRSINLPPNCINATGCCWRSDAQRIAIQTAHQQIWIADPELRQIAVLKSPGQLKEMTWSPDLKHLLAITTGGLCQVWNENWKPQSRFQVPAIESSTAWSAEGERVTLWSSDSSLFEWDALSGRQTRATLILPERQSVAFGVGGNIEYATEHALQHLVCLQEDRSRVIQIVEAADFYRTKLSDSKHDGDKPR